MKVYEFLLGDGSVFSTVPTNDPEREFENTKLHTPIVSYREKIEAEPTLEEFKEKKRLEMKVIRDQKEAGGFFYLDKTFDSDEKSVSRIGLAAQSATLAMMMGQDFSDIDWTTQDNSVVKLSAEQLAGMPVALAQHSAKLHYLYNQLKNKIAEVETIEQLNQICWPEEVAE